MNRGFKKITKKVGLPPGTLVHTGERKIEKVRITCIEYDEEKFSEKEVERVEECLPSKDTPTITWINIEGIHQLEIIEKLGELFNLHPLVLEDIVDTGQLPKKEDYGDYLFVVFKLPYYDGKDNAIRLEQISLVVGSHFVISFQEGKERDIFNPVRERIKSGKGRIRKMGTDYLAYALIDAIVDSYFATMEKIGEKIEIVEEKLVSDPTQKTLREIHELKREMIFLRKSIWPVREVIWGLERGESPLIHESTEIYLRDVYDHTIQIIETLETFREMVYGMVDIYLSSISNRLNIVMKFLTIIATIFMPLTFLAGVYGMNFKFMPELEWRWGYPLILLVMATVGISMMAYFKRKKWL